MMLMGYSNTFKMLSRLYLHNAEINYYFVMVYQKRGNRALAKKHLEKALLFDQEFNGKKEAQSVLAAL